MSTYEPGTVAVATVRGVENVRVFRRTDHHGYDRWETATTIGGWVGHDDSHVTDIRPLFVLDLDPNAHIGVPQMLADLRRDKWFDIADQIEAQTKPPRIPEPGLWGVVEAQTSPDWSTVYFEYRVELARHSDGWRCSRGLYHWDDLIDPVLVRDGIEAQS